MLEKELFRNCGSFEKANKQHIESNRNKDGILMKRNNGIVWNHCHVTYPTLPSTSKPSLFGRRVESRGWVMAKSNLFIISDNFPIRSSKLKLYFVSLIYCTKKSRIYKDVRSSWGRPSSSSMLMRSSELLILWNDKVL